MGAVMLEASRGVTFLVDAADLDLVSQYRWFARPMLAAGPPRFYIATNVKGAKVYLHRMIMQPSEGLVVDHINGKPEDNRRANLECVTHAQNIQRQRQRYNATGFRGVEKYKGGFRGKIMVNKKGIVGPKRSIASDAARDYDQMATEYFGQMAAVNFPSAALALAKGEAA